MEQRFIKASGHWERKDPITGVWVLSPFDPYALEMTAEAGMKMAEESENERKKLMESREAQKFVDNVVADLHKVHVEKPIHASVKESFRESSTELIFDGIDYDSHDTDTKRFVAACWSTTGSFYEPPDGECTLEPLKEKVANLDGYIYDFVNRPLKGHPTPWPPVDEKEKKRRETIIRDRIKEADRLRQFL
jgi:hypothetical protein